MNKTIITKVTNQKIGNSTVAQYTANIQNPEIIGSHLLTNDFKDTIAVIPKKISNPLTQDEEKLNSNKIVLEYTDEEFVLVNEAFAKIGGSKEKIVFNLLGL
jgi:hypothetical protein